MFEELSMCVASLCGVPCEILPWALLAFLIYESSESV